MKTLLWLDDIRDPYTQDWIEKYNPLPKEWDIVVHWVKDYKEFIFHISEKGLPDGICFDHDLGMEVALKAREKGLSKRASRKLKQEEKTGYDCAKWLVDYCMDNNLKLPKWNIQSANPAGKENIKRLLENFEKHGK